MEALVDIFERVLHLLTEGWSVVRGGILSGTGLTGERDELLCRRYRHGADMRVGWCQWFMADRVEVLNCHRTFSMHGLQDVDEGIGLSCREVPVQESYVDA